MYGSSLRLVTRRPRDSRIAAREAAAMPFPREETTPPVTNTNLVMAGQFRKFAFYRNSMPRDQARDAFDRADAHAMRRLQRRRARTRLARAPCLDDDRSERHALVSPNCARPLRHPLARRSRPTARATASIAGVFGVPATSARSGIITCAGLSRCALAAAPDRGADRSRASSRASRIRARSSDQRGRFAGVDLLVEQRTIDGRRLIEIARRLRHVDERRRAIAQQRRDARDRRSRCDADARRSEERRQTPRELVGVEPLQVLVVQPLRACRGRSVPATTTSPARSNQPTNSSTPNTSASPCAQPSRAR